MNLKYHLILASESPRRQALLKQLDLDFEVRSKSVDESFPSHLPVCEVAAYLAVKKSTVFGTLKADQLLITADTLVISNREILGKPCDKTAAKKMLKKLSANTHQVTTGVCLRTNRKKDCFTETTHVNFAPLSEEMIDYYIERYRPFDKAGAYGIQEWIGMTGIRKITGDYYNVMGLPLYRLYHSLINF